MARRRKRPRVPVPVPVERALDAALDKALAIQRPVVLAYLDRARGRRPDATPADVIALLERRYLAATVGLGAAAGGTAALPGVGTGASIATGAAEITGFVGATAMYVLAVAELHSVPVSDPQVRRALVLTALVGESAGGVLGGGPAAARPWATVIGRSTSKEQLAGMNARLGHLLLTRFGARQGLLMFGRAVPFGVGAGIGAAGNAALSRAAIAATRKAFGPAPRRFPHRVIDA